MTTESALQIFLIGTDEGPMAPSGFPPEATGNHTMRAAPLDEIGREAAFLWVPLYLPPDFVLTSGLWNRNPDIVELTYKNARSTGPGSILVISEFRRARLSLVSDHSKQVGVRGRDGFLVRGGWVRRMDGPVRWVTEGIKRLICDLGDGVAMITWFGQNRPDDTTLLRIAESLERY